MLELQTNFSLGVLVSLEQVIFVKNLFIVMTSVLLSCLLITAYSNTFTATPALDDFHSWLQNPSVKLDQINFQSLARLARTQFGVARFIPMLTFALDYWVGGARLVFFHVTNLLTHIICALIVFILAGQLFRIEEKRSESTLSAEAFGISVAAIWSLNPVQTSAVTYIVQRMASIQALFFMSSVCFFILARKALERGHSVRAKILFVATLGAGVLALLSKENSMMLPVVWVLTELWFFEGKLFRVLYGRIVSQSTLAKCGMLGVVLMIIAVSACLGVTYAKDIIHGYSGRHFSLSERLLTESRIILWYVSLFFWPIPSRLSLEHDIDLSVSLFRPLSTLFSIALICGMLFFAARYRKRFPVLTFAVLWYLVNLVIESTVVPLELIFEHRLYLPSFGLALGLVTVIREALKKIFDKRSGRERDIIMVSGCAVLAAFLCLGTFFRNEVWASRLTLYADAVRKAPEHPRARANLAMALVREGRYELGIEQAKAAVTLMQPKHEQYYVAGTAMLMGYVMEGRYEEGVREGERLMERIPPDADADSAPDFFIALSECYRKTRRLEDAYRMCLLALEVMNGLPSRYHKKQFIGAQLEKIASNAIDEPVDLDGDGQVDPGAWPVTAWVGKKLLDLEETGEASRFLRRALLKDPGNKECEILYRRARLVVERNAYQDEKWSFSKKYLKMPSSLFDLYMAAGILLSKIDLETIQNLSKWCIRRAIDVNPISADPLLALAWIYYKSGDLSCAIDLCKRAIDLDPNYAKAWLAMGFFCSEMDSLDIGLSAFRHTLELYPGCPKKRTISLLIDEIENHLAKPRSGLRVAQGDG
jgi:tetratricopeptide (TPR) repeat protein